MPNTEYAGIYYPAATQDAMAAADMMEMADTIEPGLNLICEDAADRDDRFANVPAGQIVTSVTGVQWVKVSAPPAAPLWKQTFSDSGLIESGIIAQQTGWPINYQRGIIRAGWAQVDLGLTNDTGGAFVSTGGDISNEKVCSLLGQWLPMLRSRGQFSDSSGMGGAYANTNGDVFLSTLSGAQISDGESIGLTFYFPVSL